MSEKERGFKITINGIDYEKIPPPPKPKPMGKMMTAALMLSGMGMMYSSRNSQTLRVNIVEEFKLIQNKQSKLSASERREVDFQFKKAYKPTNPNAESK